MQTGHCSRCGQLRTTDQLNGYNPLTADFSSAYCREITHCHSAEAEATLEELCDELYAEEKPQEQTPFSRLYDRLEAMLFADQLAELLREFAGQTITVPASSMYQMPGNPESLPLIEVEEQHIVAPTPRMLRGRTFKSGGYTNRFPEPLQSDAPIFHASAKSLGEGYQPSSALPQLPPDAPLVAAEKTAHSRVTGPEASGHPVMTGVPTRQPIPDMHGQCPQCGLPARQNL